MAPVLSAGPLYFYSPPTMTQFYKPSVPVITIQGRWEEAFDKFGFDDGDGLVETDRIADVLRLAGYDVHVERWGIHNTVIASICKDGQELIPYDRSNYQFGYDEPRDFLPAELVQFLDDHVVTRCRWW